MYPASFKRSLEVFMMGLLANGWKLQSPITDLHRQVIRHARRTTKSSAINSITELYNFQKVTQLGFGPRTPSLKGMCSTN